MLLEQEELCRRQYAEFQSIQTKLRERLAVLQLENIQLKQLRDRTDMQTIRPELMSSRLDDLQRELEHNITECLLTNNQLQSLQEDYSIINLNQALKVKDEELVMLQNRVISLENQAKEVSCIQSVRKETLPITTSASCSVDGSSDRRFDQALRTIKDLEKKNQSLVRERDQLVVELNKAPPHTLRDLKKKAPPLRDSKHFDTASINTSLGRGSTSNDENKPQYHDVSFKLPQLRQAFHAMMTSENANDVNCHCDFICKLLDMPALDERIIRNTVANLAPTIASRTSWNGVSTELKTGLPTLLKSYHSIIENDKRVSVIPNRELWI